MSGIMSDGKEIRNLLWCSFCGSIHFASEGHFRYEIPALATKCKRFGEDLHTLVSPQLTAPDPCTQPQTPPPGAKPTDAGPQTI